MNINLDGQWRLSYWPEHGGKNSAFGEYPKPEASGYLNAFVPGEVQLDLQRAGLEPDPFFSDNYYSYIKYEHYSWLYSRTFTWSGTPENECVILRFGGIDTVADIFLNGVFLGHTEDMFVEHEFDATDSIRTGENELSVHIHSSMNFVRSKYYPAVLTGSANRNQMIYIRKAGHSFGWDIAPRIMTAGLWRSVSLYTRKQTYIKETYYAVTDVEGDAATLRWAVRFDTDADTLDGFLLRFEGECGDSRFSFESVPNFVSLSSRIRLENLKLWWPKGYGGQNLYKIRLSLIYNGETVDEKTEMIGLRHLRLERDFTPGAQKFCFYVNNEPIFCKGSNWVPLDAFHSRAKERIEKAVGLLSDCGCNIIRSWGGGIYEDDLLYDLCDREGILLWQDFAMGNTTYPLDGSLDSVLSDEIGKLLCRIRNHACVAVYSADNEVDAKNSSQGYPDYASRYSKIAHELLPRLIQEHDPYRQYLASSPEIPDGFCESNVPEQHTWGARAWYKDPFYRDSTASFIGEAGYHGCPSPESIKKFVSPEDLWPTQNRSWAAHSTDDLRYGSGHGRNEMMKRQVEILFGNIPDDLDEFAFLSQVSQAEAFKFFIERSRSLKWRRSGIIWWNMLDCWPQISDAVVDYYFCKKLAYDYIKRSQQPVLVFCGELSGWKHPVIASNDTLSPVHITYRVTDADSKDVLAEGESDIGANENKTLCYTDDLISTKRMLLTEWQYAGKKGFNHYLTGVPPYDVQTMKRWVGILNKYASDY